MNRFASVVFVALFLLLPVGGYAASVEDTLFGSSEKKAQGKENQTKADEIKKESSFYDSSADELGLDMTEAQSGPDLESLKNIADLEEEKQKKLTGKKDPGMLVKSKLAIRVDAGDSQMTVRWSMPAGSQKDLDGTRFTVMYGKESGNYEKKIPVGKSREFRIRGLINHQLYFVRVQGQGKDAAIKDPMVLFTSDEVQATPLPEEEAASSLERSFSRKAITLQSRKDDFESEPVKREISQFGYDFFKNSTATSPTETSAVGNDYTIGPGDTIRIDMWGSVNARHELEVSRNGEIAIPKVGVVKVWGLSYGQAKEAINRAISRYLKGYELNVTLGSLRTIQIFLVGEVAAPGTYQITSLGGVINALSLGGGPSKNGSLRKIQLVRSGKVVQEIDLYDMFLSGDRSRDVRLENGDTIFVPVIGPVVAVAGEVRRPAIYELKGATPLDKLIAMAGGITAAGDRGRIQLERFEENNSRIVLDYEAKSGTLDDSLRTIEIHDRDMLKVYPINSALRQVVALQGNVYRPGEYQYKQGMRVSDLLPGYGSLLPDTWLDSAEIVRLAPPDHHREVLTFNLRKALAGDETENVPLLEQDTVQVFSKSEKEEKQTVTIGGQVVKPGTYDYSRNMTVRDLITTAGSPKANALLENSELTSIVVEQGRAKTKRTVIDLTRALAGDPAHNLTLQPGDVLIVRGIVDWLDAKDRFITLNGEVRYPGVYSISKGEKISSLIERAGGFTEKAYLKGAKFTRVSVQQDQQKRMEEVIKRSELEITRKMADISSVASSSEEIAATKAALEGLSQNIQKLKAMKAEGRIVVHLAPLDTFKRSPYDLEVMGGDTLTIPQTPNVVNVMGDVYNSATLVYMPGKDVSYYLKKAGGPTKNAEEDEMYIVKADGTVISRQQSTFGLTWDEDGKRWTFGSFMAASMNPGDTLVVPQKLERTAWIRNIKEITTILSQVAITAGVIVAAGL